MARNSKYETLVKPRLDEIRDWVTDYTEEQIAKKLGISRNSLTNYKNDHPELKAAIEEGKSKLIKELKDTLKKKAKGFTYKETKKSIRKLADGTEQVFIEEYEKYAQPDTGAIHLLLKNLDPEWTNDDKITIKLKKEQLEIAKTKAEADSWTAEGG